MAKTDSVFVYDKSIALRPRFQKRIKVKKEDILNTFRNKKATQKDLKITAVDDHIFIKLPQEKQHFWSPQLHLEINDTETEASVIYGLFGPNPTVWTMFMFFHFLVATFFFAFGIWAYSNWSLEKSYAIQLFLTLFMIILWFVLYFCGTYGPTQRKT